MIGETNANKIIGGAQSEATQVLNITLTTNQLSHNDLIGAVVTVSYGSTVLDFTWGGEIITISVPMGTEYTIKYTDVENYLTPETQIYTATEDVKNVTGIYKCESVTVNVSSNADLSNFTVKCSNCELYGDSLQYRKIDYIESTGTQYISVPSGMIKKNQTAILTGHVDDLTEGYICGGSLEASYGADKFLLKYEAGVFTFECAYSTYTINDIGLFQHSDFEITLSDSIFSITLNRDDGTTNSKEVTITNASWSDYDDSIYFCIFAAAAGGTPGTLPVSMKLYSLTILNNDGTVFEQGIPVLDSTNKAILYSTSNNGDYYLFNSKFLYDTANIPVIYHTQTEPTGTFIIPHNTGYQVYASDVAGFVTPNKQTFIADSVSRTVDVVYAQDISSGVYIQTTDNKYYTYDEWPSVTGKTANGIAVFTDNCNFVIALQDTSMSPTHWSTEYNLISGIITTGDRGVAITDYAGYQNTQTILSNTNDDYAAAGSCDAFTFPNGRQGYLPALGEWQIAYNNITMISLALSACGGNTIDGYYWSSTQYYNNFSWVYEWNYGYGASISKESGACVRAFQTIY